MAIVRLAKSAGFCFGVNRALENVRKLLSQGEKVVTLGPIIHNPQIVDELSKHGVKIVKSPEEVLKDSIMVIRSHGVPADVKKQCTELGIKFLDATCPFVSKIHKIVEKYSTDDTVVLIAGDKNHPEVRGIIGNCKTKSIAFANSKEFEEIWSTGNYLIHKKIVIVAQTTFSTAEWNKILVIAKKLCTNLQIFDTICDATCKRQFEAQQLAKSSDAMIVIGGKNSSNTNKLKELCELYCDTYLVETAEEIPIRDIKGLNCIGITAGASTPSAVIGEAIKKLENLDNQSIQSNVESILDYNHSQFGDVKKSMDLDQKIGSLDDAVAPQPIVVVPDIDIGSSDENFAEMLEDSFKSFSESKLVKGTVENITATDVFVDIGRKQSGIIPRGELSIEDFDTPSDIVSLGDELELFVLETNENEGTVILSKKRVELSKAWDELQEVSENKSIISCSVTSVIKGGAIANYKGVRVFIPGSMISDRRNVNPEVINGKEVRVKIIEFDRARRRVVASMRAVLEEEKQEKERKVWESLEVGNRFDGTVRGIAKYGVFVDIGGVDGLLHVSELSWSKVSDPSQIVSVGNKIDVYVKSFDKEKKRIELGHKDPNADPWKIIERDYPIGSIVEVKAVRFAPFGVFVSVIPGVDGLIHISQISNKRINKPEDAIQIGDTAMAIVTKVDVSKRQVGLSIRKLLEDELAKNIASGETRISDDELPENVHFTTEEEYKRNN